MAKGPAVVVVARHGARLDAADKTWHLSSPTPYDPPLSYGGWAQGKALGLRIAALLHQRDTDQLEAAKNTDADTVLIDPTNLDVSSKQDRSRVNGFQPPKKKRKIVIHSSPYLRCLQTSTAVAAGISQYKPPTVPKLRLPSPAKEKTESPGKSPLTNSIQAGTSSFRPSNLVPLVDPKLEVYPKRRNKILLRIDAFLGEWLSPDYYEDITPPPNSTLMVAGAKADLLRRGDYIQEMANAGSSKGFFPGGWVGKGATAVTQPKNDGGASPTLGSLASMSAFRERSNSQGSASLSRTRSRENVTSATHIRNYEPPVPSYSVSPADPIPRGYYSHAQEACILVDFQWDSMRPPQEWGDGGEYGDEWSTMHKRFRRGLAGMMQWYREHGAAPPKEQIAGFMFKQPLRLTPMPVSKRGEPSPSLNGDASADEEEELVLILLTHGAGCNALLGAISNQPVLVDVGLASLSMAVRRDEPRKASVPTIHERRLSVADPGMAETYEMKLMASVDHLKPGADPSKLSPQSQVNSPAVLPSPSTDSRRRFSGSPGANSPTDSPFSIGDPFKNWNSSLGSMRRTMSSGSNKSYMQSNLNPSGIAPMIGAASSDGRSSPGADMVLNFSNQRPNPKRNNSNTTNAVDGTSDMMNDLAKLNTNEEKEVNDSVAPLPRSQNKGSSSNASGLWGAKVAPKNASGLWGPPRLDDIYEHGRGPKRRWTVTEREEGL
ncbi:hypothetical protein GQ44DRAFT_736550 [Phaeosphaeriaceae sp. PMI808]|nr:hypothetical protein GQ44DRAFT_736550 [Phaeosphaeriaceae sp. PMI808]